MKTITKFISPAFVFCLCLLANQTNAQTLLGLTPGGGDSAGGVMFQYNVPGSKDSLLHQFSLTPENALYNSLTQGPNGILYGFSAGGGDFGNGCLFQYDTATGVVTVLASFNGSSNANPKLGQSPCGKPLLASDGNIYGMATYAGPDWDGSLFQYNTTTHVITVIHSFNGAAYTGSFWSGTGSNPYGSLIQGTDGNLYGMTSESGAATNGTVESYGTIFKCSLSGAFTTLYGFYPAAAGGAPQGSLIQATDGILYGLATKGGSQGSGAIFECTTYGAYSTLVSFDSNTTGETPYGSLIQAYDGNLYGMTSQGGAHKSGTIFRCTTSGTLTVLATFDSATDGKYPYGDLIQAADSNFYGLTSKGGSAGKGIMFKCTRAGVITKMIDFNNTIGITPTGSLLQTTDGSLYGMTDKGGFAGFGTIFKTDLSGKLTTAYTMGGLPIGNTPFGNLMEASDGNIFGMTYNGGKWDRGTIFKYSASGTLTTLITFNDTNGAYPQGSLIQATDGNLYGMTSAGGANNHGTLFQCSEKGVFNTLVNFDSITNGCSPFGSLLQATDGNLYGMTYSGGSASDGTLFKCTLTGALTTLVNFSGANGKNPEGSLIQAYDGNLYGMTSSGGTGYGTIFRSTTSGAVTILHSFIDDPNGIDGDFPSGDLIQATDSNLYGMTPGGGNGSGVLLRCTTTGTYNSLVIINGAIGQGAFPRGNVIQASDGNLYGMIEQGGKPGGGYGALFRYTLAGNYTTLLCMNDTDGESPSGSLLELKIPTSINQLESNNFFVSQNAPNPFNKSTKIIYNLTQDSKVEFSVYDIMGRKLYNTSGSYESSGEHSLILNASQFSSGIYFYTFTINGQSFTRKMVVE
ncbi:MAG: choice-of-anchor tandem repeat GloVer-containing protein [Bacteroidia bacterium]